MTRTLNRLALSILSLVVMATAAFGQASTGTGHAITGTWSGMFALKNPNGTVSHNRVVVKLEARGAEVTGSIGSSIDGQSDSLAGRVSGGVIAFRVSAGRVTEFRLHLSNGHLYGHAFGVGENRSERADLDLQPAPALLPHADLVAEIRCVDRQVFEAYQDCDVSRYASFLSSDLEFYQDNIGVRNRSQILTSMKDRCNEGIRLLRRLDEKTLVINAVPGYDAVEAGTHRIYSIQEGSEHLDATVQFTQIWTKKTGHWQLLRVVSFDHH
jgi:ketosteroid isomerase-like protein